MQSESATTLWLRAQVAAQALRCMNHFCAEPGYSGVVVPPAGPGNRAVDPDESVGAESSHWYGTHWQTVRDLHKKT